MFCSFQCRGLPNLFFLILKCYDSLCFYKYFLKYLPTCLYFVHRNKIDFCILTLYPVAFLYSLINSSRVLVNSLGLSGQTILFCLNRVFVVLLICFLDLVLNLMSSTSNIMQNKRGERLILGKSSHSPLNMMSVTSIFFWQIVFFMLRKFSYILIYSWLVQSFHHKWLQNTVTGIFCVFIDMCDFSPSFCQR